MLSNDLRSYSLSPRSLLVVSISSMVYERKTIVTRADTDDNIGMKRKSFDGEVDIISDLPTAVLYKIVQCLPLRDAAGISILSPKWHQIWTSIPSLVFDEQFYNRVKLRDLFGLVSKILIQHKGPILKFALSVPSALDTPNVNVWMSYLSSKDLRDFSVHNKHKDMPIELSSQLYYLVGLEKLKLTTCTIYTSVRFRGFPNLTILELVEVSIPYSVLRDVLGGCPLLEKLELTHCVGLQQSNIIIDAPKLTHFIINSEFCSLQVKNGENLESASITVMHKMSLFIEAYCNDLINALQCSSKLEMLALGGYLCRVIFRQGHRVNIFQNLKDLELLSLVLDDLDDFLSTMYCIQSLSNVERLNIYVNRSQNLDDNVLGYNPDWTLHNLRCANFNLGNASNTELKLIEYLLGCSPMLEKLSVSFMTCVGQSMYSRVLLQLTQFRSVSHKVDLYLEPLVIMPERFKIF